MDRYIILAQSKVTARALGNWLNILPYTDQTSGLSREYTSKQPFKGLEFVELIVSPEVASYDMETSVRMYENLVDQIEELASDKAGSMPLNELTVIVDTVKPHLLNPLAEGGWNHLLAMLILTFPEIHWFFGVIFAYPEWSSPNNDNQVRNEYEEIRKSWGEIEPFHTLAALLIVPHRIHLFDSTSLRNFVRRIANLEFLKRIQQKLVEEGKSIEEIKLAYLKKTFLPVRTKTAAVIDEDINYAQFQAYVAYRFGYRAEAVTSWALMKYLFSNENKKTHGFHLLLEDVNLNFPDKPGDVHLSKFRRLDDDTDNRAWHCPSLDYKKVAEISKIREDSKFRIMVSSGHDGAVLEKMKANREFIEYYKGKNGSGYVPKPVGGMFDLWEKADLFIRLDPSLGDKEAGRHNGQAPGFFWPSNPSILTEEGGGHSAPGKLMLISQRLILRAHGLITTSASLQENLHGAVLVTDAMELLRFQTPTLALQALSLKHEFEVRAEVDFLGVGYHFDLERRMREMEREVEAAAQFFRTEIRKIAELDSLVSIGNRLMLEFRKGGQFDEEVDCLNRIRSWHRQLRRKQSRNMIGIIANRLMAYAEWLLVSPKRFIGMLFAWFTGLWMSWGLCGLLGWWSPEKGSYFIGSASAAWNSFAIANPSPASNAAELALNIVGSAAGLFHLGVFISYLYSTVSRR